MIQYRKGTCSRCNEDDVIIVKRMASGNLCPICNKKRLDEGKTTISPIYPLKKRKEPTGELILFNALWKVRPHVSFVSGECLGDELNVCFMAHVLPKAKNKYPAFKLYDRNIIFLTFDEHYLFDFGSKESLKQLPSWKKVFELEAELKEEYKKLI